jgi:hypothetical protein
VEHVFTGTEAAADEGAGAKRLEQLGRRAHRGHEACWPAAVSKQHLLPTVERHRGEPGDPAADVEVLLVVPVRLLPEDDEVVRVRVRQWFEQDAPDDAEHGCGSADREGEGED